MKDILIETSLVANTILLEENGKVFDNALIYNGFKKNYFYVNIFEDNVLIAKFFGCFLDVFWMLKMKNVFMKTVF